MDLTTYNLLDKEERVRVGLDIYAAIAARPALQTLDFLEEVAQLQERIVTGSEPAGVIDVVRPSLPSSLPYRRELLSSPLSTFEISLKD